ncbi:hypothetical protein SEMRO_1782_G297151.1 [Seminavis robusta]|uniref:Uncharacterized protein n=1 Tax=Seminavis robusta TaxID=568900 RepID=A0A9N8EW52_9STRA|nr:hypothetical protein SEMRO_1782_G297151.1 [Seminavis robusta]|eukprot:Sro1782_g297151.1  (102) ;mRNA; f:9543-9848
MEQFDAIHRLDANTDSMNKRDQKQTLLPLVAKNRQQATHPKNAIAVFGTVFKKGCVCVASRANQMFTVIETSVGCCRAWQLLPFEQNSRFPPLHRTSERQF